MAIIRKTLTYGEHELVLETGQIARQATAAVMVRLGETVVLVTVVGKKEMQEGRDFFPLTVNYQEKTYAAGKIPGGFFRREGRPGEHETLTCRLIDRPLRPLFPKGYKNEVQVVATVMSLDPQINSDIPAMIGASAAVAISGMPFNGPFASARVGYADGIYLLNPTKSQLVESELNLVVASTENAVLMVESEASELPERVMLGAVKYGHEMQQAVISLIKEMAQEVGTPPWDWQPPPSDDAFRDEVAQTFAQEVGSAYQIQEKVARQNALSELSERAVEQFSSEEEDKALEEKRQAEEWFAEQSRAQEERWRENGGLEEMAEQNRKDKK